MEPGLELQGGWCLGKPRPKGTKGAPLVSLWVSPPALVGAPTGRWGLRTKARDKARPELPSGLCSQVPSEWGGPETLPPGQTPSR